MRAKYSLIIVSLCIVIAVSLSSSYKISNGQESNLEQDFIELFLDCFGKENNLQEIPILDIQDFSNIENENSDLGIVEIKKAISALPKKTELIQDKKSKFHKVRWEDFELKKAFETKTLIFYIGKLYLFGKEDENIETLTFKIVKVDSKKIGVVDIHGAIVNDVLEVGPDIKSRK